jgi:general secretion pathway protein M
MRPLSSRERKIAALGALALLLWMLWYLLIELVVLSPVREMVEEATALRERQQHYAGLIAQGQHIAAQLEESLDDADQHSSLLAGDDPNAVAADLMQLALDRIGDESDQGPGCEVTQRMPIAPSQEQAEPYRQVKVSLTLSCAIEPLANVLHSLEYGQPSLFIDQLSIRRTASAPSTGGPGRLEVHLLVRGYLSAANGRGGEL